MRGIGSALSPPQPSAYISRTKSSGCVWITGLGSGYLTTGRSARSARQLLIPSETTKWAAAAMATGSTGTTLSVMHSSQQRNLLLWRHGKRYGTFTDPGLQQPPSRYLPPQLGEGPASSPRCYSHFHHAATDSSWRCQHTWSRPTGGRGEEDGGPHRCLQISWSSLCPHCC